MGKRPRTKPRPGRPPTASEQAAIRRRDPRFDGRFFIAVRTTGIYCRPICPAQPLMKNIDIFDDAARAEAAGYRPCQRCRPESAPASGAWIGAPAVVRRALRALGDPAHLAENEDDFAARFGVSARHLRRLFEKELGQSPRRLMLDQRLNFARKLVRETKLPMTEVAASAGFRSLRRFNHAFRERFHEAPRAARGRAPTEGGAFRLRLAYRPPLDWAHALGYFRHHQIPGVEFIDETGYEREFADGWFRVEPAPGEDALLLQVWTEKPAALFALAQRVRAMFDLDSDPLWVEAHFDTAPVLGRLVRATPGLRVARAYSPFEAMVGTVLGQLVAVSFARELMGDLVRHYGTEVPGRHGARRFPAPEVLRDAPLKEIRTTAARKRAIRELAALVARGELDLGAGADVAAFKARLLAIPGLGPWSAEYMALRALGDPDAFPGTDLILKRALARHRRLDPERFRPWRGYAAVHLWHRYAKVLAAKTPRKGKT